MLRHKPRGRSAQNKQGNQPSQEGHQGGQDIEESASQVSAEDATKPGLVNQEFGNISIVKHPPDHGLAGNH